MPNANVEKIKASLLKEIKGVFCEGYCLYYKVRKISIDEAIRLINKQQNE